MTPRPTSVRTLVSGGDTVLERLSMSERMLDRLMHHGYAVHHAVPGREGGKVEHRWGCGLSLGSLVVVVVPVVP